LEVVDFTDMFLMTNTAQVYFTTEGTELFLFE